MSEENKQLAESGEEQQVLGQSQMKMLDTALKVQGPLARGYVKRLRNKHPEWNNEQLHTAVEDKFRKLMTATGAGVGGVAALPVVGTVSAVALTAGEGVAFAEACAFLTLAVAEIYGVNMADASQRQTVTMALLGGEEGAKIMTKALGKQGVQWETLLGGNVPPVVLNAVNRHAKKWLQRKVATKLGSVWFGRLLPFGIGAVIGGVGNHMIAKSVIAAQRQVFASVARQHPEIEGETVSGDEA
ncbi:hypothetical protein KRX53_08255 [Dermabacteraceae bacterium TAE3-ERU5]|nr:hypothetical protein [Dermabacteraceae bacterium TAE3-ERU5]